jgi:hypothetical protein
MNKRPNEKVRKKIVFKLFFAWQDQKEQHWLEQMAVKGWLLNSYFFLFYEFTYNEPREYIYRIDYKLTPDKDLHEYKEIFAQGGWEHVCSFSGWQYFRIPKAEYSTDIYTDAASRIEVLKRRLALAFVIAFPSFTFLFILRPYQITRYGSVFQFILGLLSIFMLIILILLGVWVYKLYQHIRKLEKEI